MLKKYIKKQEKFFFTLPALIFIVLMVLAPVLYTILLSFTEWSMAGFPKIVYFSNYASLIKDSRFINAFMRTCVFSTLVVATELALGTAIAIYLNRNFVGKSIIKTLFLLPMVATPVSIGLVWMLIYEPTFGIINTILSKIGFVNVPLWLGDPDTALLSLMIVDIWQWTPMIALIVMSGISALPSAPFESAQVDGAKKSDILFKIMIPMLLPTIVVAGLLRVIEALKTFDIIYATTQGGPVFSTETLNIFSFITAFQYFDLGYASAVLCVLFVLVIIICIAVNKLRDKVRIDF